MREATLDIYKAIEHLRKNAHATTLHRCATYVKKALAAGGLPYLSGSNGVDVGAHYEREYGYKRVNLKQEGKNFIGMMPGDICSISVYSHNMGHACMYDGYKWISDFKQANCIPYTMSNVRWARVWRWKDLPGDFNIPPEEGDGAGGSGGGGGGGPAQIIIVPNQYPTHSEYITYDDKQGNIFEVASKNGATFSSAALANNTNEYFSPRQRHKHTRIYSTNDSCILLDELKFKVDPDETWANNGITQKDVDARYAQLKKKEEEVKKKQEEEKKKKEEEEKKKKEEEEKKNSSTGGKDSKDKDKGKGKNSSSGK